MSVQNERSAGTASGRPAHEYLEAGGKILQARASEYDQPGGERSAGRVAAAWSAITGKAMSATEGWLFLALLKLARLQQAPGPHHDSATDAAVYAALMGESKERRQTPAERVAECNAPRDTCQPPRDQSGRTPTQKEHMEKVLFGPGAPWLSVGDCRPAGQKVTCGGPVSSGPCEKGSLTPGSTLEANVVGCARCGGTHRGLVFKRMARPLAYPDDLGALTHFAPCPVTGDPVLLGHTPDAPSHTERDAGGKAAQTVEGYATAWGVCPTREEVEAARRAEAAAPWGKMPPADLIDQIGTSAGGVLVWEFGGKWWEFGLHMPTPRETTGPGAAMEGEAKRVGAKTGCQPGELKPVAVEVRPDRFAVQLSERSWVAARTDCRGATEGTGVPQAAAWMTEASAVEVARRVGGRKVLHPMWSGPMSAKQPPEGKPGLPTGADSGSVKGPGRGVGGRGLLCDAVANATGMRPGTAEFVQAFLAVNRFIERQAWSLGDGETLDQRMRDDACPARGAMAEAAGPTPL